MSLDLIYTNLRGSESCGRFGTLGIKIMVSLPEGSTVDLDSDPISFAAMDAVDKVKAAIMEAIIAADPKAQAHRVAERAQIVGLFGGCALFVEEVPNGYDPNSAYTKHLPWFVVTTPVGRITIGWRKRVISIDWSATVGTKDSSTLFAAEEVTMDTKLIHAWSTEKAATYIAAIIGSATA